MALPRHPTPARLAAFLRRNDAEYPNLDSAWHRVIDEWTRDEFYDVVGAAERNSSIRSLEVMVTAEMTKEEADKIASISRILGKLTHFAIFRRDEREVAPDVVDAILSGMAHSKAPLEMVSLTASGGKRAICDFIKNFPGITHICLGGYFLPISLSEEFALSIASCLTQTHLPKISSLELAYLGHDHGASQILMCSTISCPKLENLRVSMKGTDGSALVLKVLGVACSSASLKRLELSSLGNAALDLAPMFAFCPRPWPITDLSCEYCRFPKAEIMAESQALLSVSCFAAVKCYFEDTIESTFQELPKLKKVDLSYPLYNNELQSLASFFASRSKIADVSLMVTDSSEDGSFPAITALLQNGAGHLRMELHDLPFSNVDFVLRGLHCSGPHLTSVALTYTEGWEEIDNARFLQALASNETLERFEMSISDTGEQGELAQSLTRLLRLNRKLKVLKLVSVPLRFCEAILRGSVLGLLQNDSLRELHIELDNDDGRFLLSDDILRLLLDLLAGTDEIPGNRVFQTLTCGVSFPNSDPDAGVAARVQFLMKQNRLGRRSVLAVPQLHAGVLPHLLRKAAADPSAHDVMFLHVKASVDRLQEFGLASPSELGAERGGKRRRHV
jgi:hypothetical protein